ncbi:capsid protein [Torentivirus aristcris]|uniref:Capsid protein n=1 Tax=Crucivirus-295 TaxID=2761264 RepID=A0A7G5M391_9VIRU|nr:capsid protein [Crucivirus-295]
MPRVAAKQKVVYVKPAAKRATAVVRKPRAVAVKPAPAAKRKPASSMVSSLLSGGGSLLGGAMGGPAGAALGGAAGKLVGKLFGHGDYTVSNVESINKNNLVLSNAANIPQFGTGKVATKFVHREFLGDIYSAATANTFKIQSYPLNPGQASTFPWLADVVKAKYQQYRFNGCVFEFRSMSSDALNSTNTALGSVIMSTDYDSADVVFASKQEMENTEFSSSCKPSVNMLHAIECERTQTPVNELYIRAYDVPAGKDIRLYDLGRVSIATTGCQGTNVNLGELWVTYDIDCFKAIEQSPYYGTPVSEFKLSGVVSTNALGDLPPTPLVDQIGCTFVRDSGTDTVILPYDMKKGTIFSVYYAVYGASTASIPYQSMTVAGGVVGYGSYAAHPYSASLTTDNKTRYQVFKYDGTGTPAAPPTLAFTGGLVPNTITNASLVIAVIGGGYVPDGN